jgi:hypothetical protein
LALELRVLTVFLRAALEVVMDRDLEVFSLKNQSILDEMVHKFISQILWNELIPRISTIY